MKYGSVQNDPLFAEKHKRIDLRPNDEFDNDRIKKIEDRMKKIRSTNSYKFLRKLTNYPSETNLHDMSRMLETRVWFRRLRSQVYSHLAPLITISYYVHAVLMPSLSRQPEGLTGSRDLCYHNFRCSIPFYIFSDFNHIVSNMSYFLFGLSFIFLLWQKQRRFLLPWIGKIKGKFLESKQI